MGDFDFDFKRDYECYVYYFNVKSDNIMGEINEKKYILVSIARLRLDDEFLTLWQKNNQGYTDDLFKAGITFENLAGQNHLSLTAYFHLDKLFNKQKRWAEY